MQIFTIRRDASPTLFPYTTLFRSEHRLARRLDGLAGGGEHPRAPGARAARRAVLRVDLGPRSEEHTSELQSHSDLVCRLLLEKKNPPLQVPERWAAAPATPAGRAV